jgi:hypothetical protein
MFDKTIKVALICLLTAFVAVVGWFCWTRRDVGRFSLHSSESETAVFDSKTGIFYSLSSTKPNPMWIEIHPQTGRTSFHPVCKEDDSSPLVKAFGVPPDLHTCAP